MTKNAGMPPATEPDADASTEGPNIEALLRLSKDATSRRGERELDRKARIARERGWTRDQLYERGSRDAE